MNSPGIRRLLNEVELRTGFKVVVDTIEGISEDAQMISAQPEMPMHLVSMMYGGMKQIAPEADAGIDLSSEYQEALKLHQ